MLAGLRADPLARGALATLAATAALALALALVGLLLGVAGDRRDERGELFDLEAQGAAPATLRRHLRLRALLVAVFGLAGGIATGAILARARALARDGDGLGGAARAAAPTRRRPGAARGGGRRVRRIAVLLVGAATRLGGRALERAAEAAA